jgi:hypothetical protein
VCPSTRGISSSPSRGARLRNRVVFSGCTTMVCADAARVSRHCILIRILSQRKCRLYRWWVRPRTSQPEQCVRTKKETQTPLPQRRYSEVSTILFIMSRYLVSITALAALLPCVSAQNNATRSASGSATRPATSTYSQSNVPTGTPIPGNYESAYRPQVHFSPPSGFMNDPNGMFLDHNGTYHLYYQC